VALADLKDAEILALVQEAGGVRPAAKRIGCGRTTLSDRLARIKKQGGQVETTPTQAQPNRGLLDDQILKLIQRSKVTSEELAKLTKADKEEVEVTISFLQKAGYDIRPSNLGWWMSRTPRPSENTVNLPTTGEVVRFAVASDAQLCSRHQQITHFRTFHDLCAEEGCQFILDPGDVFEGIHMYKGQTYELFRHGADAQLDYGAEVYPHHPEMQKILISGNHDLSFYNAAGFDIVKHLCEVRPDLTYAGMLSAHIKLTPHFEVYMLHPDGGVPYARSYKTQKINEQLGREGGLAPVNIYGHWHVAGFNPYLGLYDLQAGCFQGQTSYLKRKGLKPDVGGWICEVQLDEEGYVRRFKPEWISFRPLKDDYPPEAEQRFQGRDYMPRESSWFITQ
jgi:transposase